MKSPSPLLRSSVVGVPLLFLAGVLQAQTLTSSVFLTGTQEVPPVLTAGTGTATVTVDPTTHVVSVTGSYTGLSFPQTDAHIHLGAFGVGGAPVVTLVGTGGTTGTFSGTGTFTAGQFSTFLMGDTYINVHSTGHGLGEIRGQIVNISGSTQLAGDPQLADNAGDPLRGPRIADPIERFNVSLDCSGAGAAGGYVITLRAGTIAPPLVTAFGYQWFGGAKLFTCSGVHAQNVVSCSAAGIVLPNNIALVGMSYTVGGFCFDPSAPPGRLSSALIQVIE
jgi:hypothetical protein